MSQSLLDLLKSHSPALFDADGNFKFNEFQTALTQADISFSQETYRLDWRGKSYAKALVYDENRTLLSANHAHNAKHSDSQNILIQGDNLAVLKHLREAYRKQIKMIYIDPPYNTGSDGFVYQDDRKYTPAEIAKITGESEEVAEYIHGFINARASSHSAWLTFMYPRLKLARELLKDDGVIFISIDDNEQAQLKLLCDEIFGEGNFVACLPTVMNLKGNNDEFAFAGTHEYTLVYCKDKTSTTFNQLSIDEDDLEDWQEDEQGFYKQGANLKATGTNAPREKRPNLFFPIFIDDNNTIFVTDDNNPPTDFAGELITLYPITNNQEMSWRWSKEKFKNSINDIIISRNGSIGIYKKQRPALGDLPSKKPKTIFYKPEYSSGNGTTQLKQLFDEKVFPNPKPLDLLMDFIQLGTNNNDLVLDFFAGSGTTAHSVMQLNSEDNGNRKFICVQLDEPVKDKSEAQKAGFNTIFEITKARIEKSIEKIKTENPDFTGDLGYKEYRIVPVPDNFGTLAESPAHGLQLLENLQLSNTDCQNILTTWCVQDGMPLHQTPEQVDLGGYMAYRYDTVLYLLDTGFDTSHLAMILRRLDDTIDEFNIDKIVILEPHFDSKAKRELSEAIGQYKPRKGNKLYLIQRNRADKG
ncbi:site-specific DNA-methyltransferase [Mannheimia bovis]|uniref:site-specific DNA-methyltransferase (adenine-specific) n=1 Tax=Mannheimia bovis TaxID=2770636 RepID=A0A7H1C4E6_9PAST|nr:site-specific DNA-methyltransferase [Mannheimia bovis]QNS15851.1 site-specific DNA-methyltransferase [Mannheimia bovis]